MSADATRLSFWILRVCGEVTESEPGIPSRFCYDAYVLYLFLFFNLSISICIAIRLEEFQG